VAGVALLDAGAGPAGAVVRGELLRASHPCRVASLPRLASAAARVASGSIRQMRAEAAEFRPDGLAADLAHLLAAAGDGTASHRLGATISPMGEPPEWATIATRIGQQRAERRKRLAGYETLVTRTSLLLFEADPIGINFEENTDEYDPEAQTIVLRLAEGTSHTDVGRLVYEEFVRWFGDNAGSADRYSQIADNISSAWQDFQSGLASSNS
jgi:hypothetical protein